MSYGCYYYALSFTTANHAGSSFDVALVGIVPPYTTQSEATLAELLRILRPSGVLLMRETSEQETSSLAKLKFSGFVEAKKVSQ